MADKINKNNVVSTNNNLKDGVSSGVVDKQAVEESKIEIGKKIDAGLSTVSSTGLGVLKIIICILIFVSLIRILRDSVASVPTFADLLRLFQNVPQFSDNILNFTKQLSINADWGIFNFLRDFFNNLTDFWSIMMWISAGIVDFLFYISYFITWIFV